MYIYVILWCHNQFKSQLLSNVQLKWVRCGNLCACTQATLLFSLKYSMRHFVSSCLKLEFKNICVDIVSSFLITEVPNNIQNIVYLWKHHWCIIHWKGNCSQTWLIGKWNHTKLHQICSRDAKDLILLTCLVFHSWQDSKEDIGFDAK